MVAATGKKKFRKFRYIPAASYIRNRYVAMVAVYTESITPLDRSCFLKRDETSHSLWSFADRDTHAAEFSLDRSSFPSGRQMDLDIYIYGSYNKDELEKRLFLHCETRQLWKTVLRLASHGISIRSILGFHYISSLFRIEFVSFTAW